MNFNDLVAENEREDALTPEELFIRNLFIAEYMVDYNAAAACIRVGFHPDQAEDFAAQFMREGYVLRGVAEQQQQPISASQASIMRSQVIHKLWEESNGPFARPSERVGALTSLTRALAIELKEDTGDDNTGPAGGVMQVPAMTDPDTWSEIAAAAQKKLKDSVRD